MRHGIRAAFFDVDGTLVSNRLHAEPASCREALWRLRAAGVLCVLATGRAPYRLGEVVSEDFDAFVTLNGQYCFAPGRLLRKAPIPRRDMAAIVEQVRAGSCPCIFFEEDRLYASEDGPRTQEMRELSGIDYGICDPARALEHDVYQLNALLHPGEEDAISSVAPTLRITRWTDVFCDVVPPDGGKERGVRAVMAAYGLRPDECVAFGDGENDLGMFDAVGTSVAMGGGSELVKARATHVTDDVEHDGVLRACQRLELI